MQHLVDPVLLLTREVVQSFGHHRGHFFEQGVRGEAIELGDENFVRHCEEQLFPFLVAERENALRMEA